jgi:ketosteroid isomerase-like protein
MIAAFAVAAAAGCSDADKKALEAFDRAWGSAGENGDKAALMKIYADDYTGLPGMQGKMDTITETMKAYERNKANPAGADKVTHDHYFITCTANSATVTHRNTVWTPDGTGGKPETFYTRSVHFLEKRNGNWQVVSNAGGGGLDDYAVVWYLEQDWNNAVLKKDKEWFEKNYAPDFSSISSTSATLMNKQQDIADSMDPKVTMDLVETTGMNIRIDGNFAVVTGVFRTKGKDDKGAFDRRIRYTDTWIRRDGRWQAWASQGTVIPASPNVAQK